MGAAGLGGRRGGQGGPRGQRPYTWLGWMSKKGPGEKASKAGTEFKVCGFRSLANVFPEHPGTAWAEGRGACSGISEEEPGQVSRAGKGLPPHSTLEHALRQTWPSGRRSQQSF